VRNSYHATVKFLLSPVLPEGYTGFIKAHLGQCGTCSRRRVTELPFGNGTRGEVHLIAATSYAMNDLVDPNQIHELLRSAAIKLDAARRDFEKTRWAASTTNLPFDQWLAQYGHSDLRFTQD